MKINRILLALSTLALAACGVVPPTNPPAPSLPAAGPPDYMVYVIASDGKDPNLERVVRVLTCDITGLDIDGHTVIITDARTKQSVEYRYSFTETTPKRILLYNYAKVFTIVVDCTIFGNSGDAIMCEFVTGDGQRPAPLLIQREFAMIAPDRDSATCYGTINTLA
jgi:hypothetical protein